MAAAQVARHLRHRPHPGANEHDLFFLQGYVHAEDRLFQMDITRRQASGTPRRAARARRDRERRRACARSASGARRYARVPLLSRARARGRRGLHRGREPVRADALRCRRSTGAGDHALRAVDRARHDDGREVDRVQPVVRPGGHPQHAGAAAPTRPCWARRPARRSSRRISGARSRSTPRPRCPTPSGQVRRLRRRPSRRAATRCRRPSRPRSGRGPGAAAPHARRTSTASKERPLLRSLTRSQQSSRLQPVGHRGASHHHRRAADRERPAPVARDADRRSIRFTCRPATSTRRGSGFAGVPVRHRRAQPVRSRGARPSTRWT